MSSTKIGERVEVDLFGLRTSGELHWNVETASGTIVGLAPGSITVRLDFAGERHTEVTVGPARLLRS